MMPSTEKEGCVVTGVAGFVGSHLAERLLSLNCTVVGIDNFFSGRRENMNGFADHPAFTFYERSIAEPGLLSELKKNHPELRYCFHLAAIVSVPYSLDHPDESMNFNCDATRALLGEAKDLGFEKFVFAGSAAEYGDDDRMPLREEYATEGMSHLSPYGCGKFQASRLVGLSPIGTALRFFNIYGPRQDARSPYSGVVSRFVDMALSGRALTIYGDGLQSRDFVFVSDAVEAYIRAVGLDESVHTPPAGIYNVGTGKSTTILELARIIQDLTGDSHPLTFCSQRAGDIRHSVAAPHAFRKATGWTSAVSLGEGLRIYLQWLSQERRRESEGEIQLKW